MHSIVHIVMLTLYANYVSGIVFMNWDISDSIYCGIVVYAVNCSNYAMHTVDEFHTYLLKRKKQQFLDNELITYLYPYSHMVYVVQNYRIWCSLKSTFYRRCIHSIFFRIYTVYVLILITLLHTYIQYNIIIFVIFIKRHKCYNDCLKTQPLWKRL